jgi:catechol 2,3-dioxygenase-like lactoylglutathione lyase family enzyme
MVEKISAVTLRVANMRASVRFYKDVLGLEIIYGSEGSYNFPTIELRHAPSSVLVSKDEVQDAVSRIKKLQQADPEVAKTPLKSEVLP